MAKRELVRYHSGTGGREMFDQILGLVLAILALGYLVYAMLRPEKF
jgi:K+-transporting ATPase KdpF subunit